MEDDQDENCPPHTGQKAGRGEKRRSYPYTGQQKRRKLIKSKSVELPRASNTSEVSLNHGDSQVSISDLLEDLYVESNVNSIAIKGPCICCDEFGNIPLSCKHIICQKCELTKQWASEGAKCDNCAEIDALRLEYATQEKQLKKAIPLRQPWQPISKASGNPVRDRCDQLHTVLVQLSGCKGAANETTESAALLAAYLQRNTGVMVALRNKNLPGLGRRLTAQQDVALWATLRISENQRRTLVSGLINFGLNVFSPNKAFEAEKKRVQLLSELKATRMKLSEGGEGTCVKVVSIKNALAQRVKDLKVTGHLRDSPRYEGKLWVTVGGDKGGSTTKLVAAIVNVSKPNSVDNLLLLGYYQGSEDPLNLRTAFGDFSAQFDSIQSLPVPETTDPEGPTKEVPVQFFFTGDTKFISNQLGHMGATSLYPCQRCLVPLSALKKALHHNCHLKYPERTIEHYQNMAKIGDSSGLTGTRLSELTNSVARPPLFRIPIAQISPPQLHIMLGIGEDLYKLLQEACWKRDGMAAGLERDESTKKKMKQTQEELDELEACIGDIKIELAQLRLLSTSLQSAQKYQTKPKTRCAGLVCLNEVNRSVSDRSNELVTCSDCYDWFHFACEGIATVREIVAETKTPYKCLTCKRWSVNELVSGTKEKIELTEKELSKMLGQLTVAKKKVDDVESIVKKNNGACSQRLTQALKDLNVDVHAYRPQAFIGRHVHNMISGNGPARLAASLGNDLAVLNERRKFETLFTNLGKIEHFLAARFLEDDEITEFERACIKYADDFKRLLPDNSITPKAHFMVSHLPEFAQRYHTLGLISEQAIESLHARVNSLERQYSAVREVEHRMILVAQHLYVSSSSILQN